jgi:ankyrin repeat protein
MQTRPLGKTGLQLSLLLFCLTVPCSADPIHDAAGRGDAKTVRALLKDTWVEARDQHQRTPLLCAARGDLPGHLETVSILLTKGADIHAKDYGGMTALHHAAFHASTPKAGGDAPNQSILRLLLGKGADVNARASGTLYGGQTPLHRAAESGSLANVTRLLEARADVSAKDDSEHTVLHSVVLYSDLEKNIVPAQPPRLPHPGHRAVVKLFLDKGVEVNAKDKLGNTAYKLARDAGWTDIAELIRQRGGRE